MKSRQMIDRRQEEEHKAKEFIRLVEAVERIEPFPMLDEMLEQEAEKYRKELEQ